MRTSSVWSKISSPARLAVPAVAVVVAYLIIVNNSGVMGYELAQRQLQLDRLAEQVKELNIQTQELSALPRIQNLSQQLGLVSGGPVEYLNSAPAVAIK